VHYCGCKGTTKLQLLQRVFLRMLTQLRKAEFVITEYFERAERNKDSLMTLTEVEQLLHSRVSAVDMPSFRELSTALTHHYQAGAVDGRRGWYMRQKK